MTIGLPISRGLACGIVAVILSSACAGTPPSSADGRVPVWIDTDPAIGEPGGGLDDAFAVLQAFGSDTLAVRGVSAVHGTAPLVRTWPVTQDLVARFGPPGMRPWRGAAGPHERHAPTEASEALATALRAERLTIVALGPLTNIAATLERDPTLQDRVERIVAVVGQRAGAPDADPNVAHDADAMQAVLETRVPLTLVSRETLANVTIDADDVVRLGEGPVAARFLAESSKDWLRHRQDTTGANGFRVPDVVAIDLVAAPGRVSCAPAKATLERSRSQGESPSGGTMQGASAPVVIVDDQGTGRPVTYCHAADEGVKARLLSALLRSDGRQ